jgi:hypothetical protein
VSTPASIEQVSAILGKVLAEGRLNRIPRNPEHRDVLLALLCLNLGRRYPYAETELNDKLSHALGELGARVDHVTCRRYLVDCGFVKRDRAGSRYLLVYPKLESTLTTDVMASASDLIDTALASANERRLAHRRRKEKHLGGGTTQET